MTSHNRTSKAGFNLLYWYLYSSNYGSCSDQFETSKKDITVGFLNVTLQGTTTPMRLGHCVKSTWKQNAIICKSYKLISSSERKVENVLSVWSKKMYHLKKEEEDIWSWWQQHVSKFGWGHVYHGVASPSGLMPALCFFWALYLFFCAMRFSGKFCF